MIIKLHHYHALIYYENQHLIPYIMRTFLLLNMSFFGCTSTHSVTHPDRQTHPIVHIRLYLHNIIYTRDSLQCHYTTCYIAHSSPPSLSIFIFVCSVLVKAFKLKGRQVVSCINLFFRIYMYETSIPRKKESSKSGPNYSILV